MTPKCLMLAGFHQLEPMAPPPRETRVGLDTFCPGTDSSLTEVGLSKFYVPGRFIHFHLLIVHVGGDWLVG